MSSLRHEPSIRLNAFNCPHCGAHAHQDWWELHADTMKKDSKPYFPDEEHLERMRNFDEVKSQVKEQWLNQAARIMSRELFFEKMQSTTYTYFKVFNLHISKCYTCNKLSIWLADKLIYPVLNSGVQPNADLPTEVLFDYTEAQAIASDSPRAAAALLRLAIQKLLPHLGERGKDINAAIGNLVRKGLDARIQRSLDIVRVVGNNAVHPGQMDLRDDRDTVNQLFHLVNLICDYGISQPKMVDALYNKLPDAVRKQIESRDGAK